MGGLEEKRRRRRMEKQLQMEERRQQIKASMEAEAKQSIARASSAHCNPPQANEIRPNISSVKGKDTKKEVTKPKSSAQWFSSSSGTIRGAPKPDKPDDEPKKLMPLDAKEEVATKERPCRSVGKKGSARVGFVGSNRRDVTEHDFGSPQSSVTFSQEATLAESQKLPPASSKQEASQDEESLDIDESQESHGVLQYPRSGSSKARRRLSSSSSSSDDSFLALAEKKFSLSAKQVGDSGKPAGKKLSPPMRPKGTASPDLQQEDRTQRNGDLDSNDGISLEKKSPLNPLTQMKVELNNNATTARAPRLDGAAFDDLWADPEGEEDDGDDDGEGDGTKKKKRGKRKAVASHQKKKAPRKESNDSTEIVDVGSTSFGDLDEEQYDKTNSELIAELKPDFEKPVFGPFDLVPLKLNAGGNDDDKHGDEGDPRAYQVPASIARYLAEYQREGVQFLFETLSKLQGCILG